MKPGDKVKLSGRFLAFTGQKTGGESAKTWVVKQCETECYMCGTGRFVNVGEPSSSFEGRDRHIACSNLVYLDKPSLKNEVPLMGKLYP